MKYGVQIRATAEGVDLPWIAGELERRGFESIFLPEHTHVPVNQQSVHPGGADLMEAAKRGYDPITALAVLAGTTRTLRLGTGVCLLPQHDPLFFAKQVATLDVLSGGRVILGVGAGWAREEMANHGVDPTRRWGVLREKVLAIRALWTQEEASFHGEYVDFGPVWQWPKPAQRPHPPILIGGDGARALQRVVDYGDGWMPNWEPGTLDRVAQLSRMSREGGRRDLLTTIYSVPHDRDIIRAGSIAGVERMVFNVPSSDKTETIAVLDRLGQLIS